VSRQVLKRFSGIPHMLLLRQATPACHAGTGVRFKDAIGLSGHKRDLAHNINFFMNVPVTRT